MVQFYETYECVNVEAPKSGHYLLAMKAVGTNELLTIEHTARTVKKGDSLGFYKTDDNKVVAYAGEQQVRLKGLPMVASYVCWHRIGEGDGSENGEQTRKKRPADWGKFGSDLVKGGADLGAEMLKGIVEDAADNPGRDRDRPRRSRR